MAPSPPTHLPVSLEYKNDAPTLDPHPHPHWFSHLAEKSFEKERQAYAQLVVSVTNLFTIICLQSLIGGGGGGGGIYPVYTYIWRLIPPVGVTLEGLVVGADSSFPLIILCLLVLRSSTFDYRPLAAGKGNLRWVFFSWVFKGVFRGVLFVLAMSALFPFYARREVAKYSGVDFISLLQPGSQNCVYNCILRASTNHSDAKMAS